MNSENIKVRYVEYEKYQQKRTRTLEMKSKNEKATKKQDFWDKLTGTVENVTGKLIILDNFNRRVRKEPVIQPTC